LWGETTSRGTHRANHVSIQLFVDSTQVFALGRFFLIFNDFEAFKVQFSEEFTFGSTKVTSTETAFLPFDHLVP
jgi:hypothetical protein